MEGRCRSRARRSSAADVTYRATRGSHLSLPALDAPLGDWRCTAWLDATAARDQTAIIAWPQTSGIPSILVGSANYEDTSATGASVLRYDPGTSKVEEANPGVPESIGPLALGDLDGDGNLDLFLG